MNLISLNSYWFRLFVAFSLLFCAIFGGQMYEPACASAWRLKDEKGFKGVWAKVTIWLMDLFEPGHCYKSWLCHQKLKAPRRAS